MLFTGAPVILQELLHWRIQLDTRDRIPCGQVFLALYETEHGGMCDRGMDVLKGHEDNGTQRRQ
jgi:hypothetical protein